MTVVSIFMRPVPDELGVFLSPEIDDLQISRDVEPACDRKVVVRFERVFMIESEVQPLALQERNKGAAELGPLRNAKP